jgi:hypothetical protein
VIIDIELLDPFGKLWFKAATTANLNVMAFGFGTY